VQVSYIFDKVSNNTKIAQIQLCTSMCQKWTFVHAKHFCKGQYLGYSFAMMGWRFGKEEKCWMRFVNESIYYCSFIYIKCVGTLLTINKLMGQSLAHQLGFFFLSISLFVSRLLSMTHVGIELCLPVFTHWQLYFALSQAITLHNIIFLLPKSSI
jgi:hypothetical protein